MRVCLLLLVATAVMASCREGDLGSPETLTTESDSVAIESLSRAFDSLLTASQEEPFLTLLTDDVAWMVPGQPALNGIEAVRGRLKWRFSTSKLDLVTKIEELRTSGEWGYMKASYQMRITPLAGGQPVDEEGKLINILQRTQDGQWKVARHLWNANHPDR
jgi:ketosteroid isomerase-like protein